MTIPVSPPTKKLCFYANFSTATDVKLLSNFYNRNLKEVRYSTRP